MPSASNRGRVAQAALLAGVVASAATVAALGFGRSYSQYLETGYSQELYGAVQLGDSSFGYPVTLSGIAFAPDGDVWAGECASTVDAIVLHRFDAQTTLAPINATSTLHPHSSVATSGGCGLTNHPDRTLYANSGLGIYRLDADTGAPMAWPDGSVAPHGPGGNGYGVAVDPRTGHLLYAGAACDPLMNYLRETAGHPTDPVCRIYDLDPIAGTHTVAAEMSDLALDGANVTGLSFDPTGTFLLVTNASWEAGFANYADRLTVLRRAAAPGGRLQLVQHVTAFGQSAGIAFSAATPGLVVTTDRYNTATRFDFPGGDYTIPPSFSSFALGGMRGDLVNVGVDGCLYASQTRAYAGDNGARYDDGTVTTEESIARICADAGAAAGFAPGVGVAETLSGPAEPEVGSVAGVAFHDLDRDGAHDSNEPGIGNVVISLVNPAARGAMTVPTDPSGQYLLTEVPPATYLVSAADQAGAGLRLATAPRAADVVAGQTIGNIDFAYVSEEALKGSVAGVAFLDFNRNGRRDAGETETLPGVKVVLSGAKASWQTTGGTGAFKFADLPAGSYALSAPLHVPVADHGWLKRTTPNPHPQLSTLGAGQNAEHIDIGYRDPNRPTCSVNRRSGAITFKDAESGLAQLKIRRAENFAASVTPGLAKGRHQAGTIVKFAAAVKHALVSVDQVNHNRWAHLVVEAADRFGNVVSCASVEEPHRQDSRRHNR
jgi:hypothetical protein